MTLPTNAGAACARRPEQQYGVAGRATRREQNALE